jgi:AbiV family abortive infection protein
MNPDNTEEICQGFEQSFRTALEHSRSARTLLMQGTHATAVSLAVLSLEEIGKMIVIDGLLFAKPGDDRWNRHKKVFRSHSLKLQAVEILPFFVRYLSELEPRPSDHPKWARTVVSGVTKVKAARWQLQEQFGDEFTLEQLDRFKQFGFYTHKLDGGSYKRPSELVSKRQARLIVAFASSITGLLEALLTPYLDQYKEHIRSVRDTGQAGETAAMIARGLANTFIKQVLDNESEV